MRTITIVSGGQTGADRAALDFALRHNIRHGGWCPRGRLAEDGRLPSQYQLQETTSRSYAERTEWNVRDSDATVVFTIATSATGGTGLTLALAQRLGKPLLHLVRGETNATTARDCAAKLLAFLADHRVRCLNVGGPRASQESEISAFVDQVFETALELESTTDSGRNLAAT